MTADVVAEQVEQGDPSNLISVLGDDPSLHGLHVRVITISPEMAETWLTNNYKHRPIDIKLVDKYAKRLLQGEWCLNGKSILFTREGLLLGGQHRLSACVKSGVAFTSLVVVGVDAAAVPRTEPKKKRKRAVDTN